MINFDEMKKYSKILVTGPQRSGTTFAAKVIAKKLGYEYIDEIEINADDLGLAKHLFDHSNKFVLQAPALSYCCQLFSRDDVLVIFMKRPIGEIVASEKITRFGYDMVSYELFKYGLSSGVISEVKYREWDKQKKKIKNWMELNYHDLKDTPFWLDENKRKGFGVKQTEVVREGSLKLRIIRTTFRRLVEFANYLRMIYRREKRKSMAVVS